MTNVFEGNPDQRQSDDGKEPLSRFRPRYRALSDEEKKLHDELKSQAVALERLFEQVNDGKPGRYKALALTSLEESIMWIVKELTGPR